MPDARDLVVHLEESGGIGLDLSSGCALCQEAAREIRYLREEVLRLSARDETDAFSDGCNAAANDLRHIAEHGRTTGVFGGEKMETSAQAILGLRRQIEQLRLDLRCECSGHAAESLRLIEEKQFLQRQIVGHADRIAAQSELLTQCAASRTGILDDAIAAVEQTCGHDAGCCCDFCQQITRCADAVRRLKT